MPFQVGIAAYGGEPPKKLVSVAEEFVKELGSKVSRDMVFILGGDWGLMGVIGEEAVKNGIYTVYILPRSRSSKSKVENAVYVKTGSSPNLRSSILVSSSDVLVVVGGGAGCMMEALMAYREGIPIIAIIGHGADSDKFFNCFKGPFDSRLSSRVYVTDSPKEASLRVLEFYREWKVKDSNVGNSLLL